MKKLLLSLVLAITMICSFALPAMAATTADVTITATPEYLAITNSEATWTIGFVAESSSYYWSHDGTLFAEPFADAEGKSIATNTGSVASDIGIHTHNPTGGVGWTLSAVAVGVNTVILGFAKGTDANKAAMGKLVDTTSQVLASDLAASGHAHWGLYLDTGTFGDGVAKTCTVTLTITKHV
jgi:hypothetical protein